MAEIEVIQAKRVEKDKTQTPVYPKSVVRALTDLIFETPEARDAYFTENPTLVNGQLCVVAGRLYIYDGENWNGNVTVDQLISTAASGTPPFVVSSKTSVDNLNAQFATRVGNFTNYQGYVASFNSSSQSTKGILIKLPVKINSSKMLSFKVRLYRSYKLHELAISGYFYATTSQWHFPKIYMTMGETNLPVALGKDEDNNAIVWIGGDNNNAGVAILDVVSGHTSQNWSQGWSIELADKPSTAIWGLDTVVVSPISRIVALEQALGINNVSE